MGFIKIYDKNKNVIFNKNNAFCLIYQHEKDKEITYSFNLSEKPFKYHSLFDYIELSKEYKINISLTDDFLEYTLEIGLEKENGRVPFKKNKRQWSKKTLSIKDENLIEVDKYKGSKNLIFKLNDDFFNKLINIQNGKK